MSCNALRLPCGGMAILEDAGVRLVWATPIAGCVLDWASLGALAALGEQESIQDPVLRVLAAQEALRGRGEECT